MYSKSHFVLSAAVGLVVVLLSGATVGRAALLVAYAAILGTAIDLDHFLIARLRGGDWSHLRFVLANPSVAISGQDRIFETGAVGDRTRMLSHLLIAGAAVGVVGVVRPSLLPVTVAVLYVHLLSDLAVDVWEHELPAQSS